MFLVDCAECGRRLLSQQRMRGLRNVAPGVIAVTLACRCGRALTVVSGVRADGRSTPRDAPGHAPTGAGDGHSARTG